MGRPLCAVLTRGVFWLYQVGGFFVLVPAFICGACW